VLAPTSLPQARLQADNSRRHSKPSIVLVDNYPAILHQMLPLISPEFEVVSVFEDGRFLPSLVHKLNPDLIVLDITLPGLNGIEIAGLLQKTGTRAKMVFFTVHADPDYAREAFHLGAMGYVVKMRLVSDLIPALKAAMSGQRFLSPCPELAALANELNALKQTGDE
jgi:DNA-binding NarL/FixJ family response regulator